MGTSTCLWIVFIPVLCKEEISVEKSFGEKPESMKCLLTNFFIFQISGTSHSLKDCRSLEIMIHHYA